MRALRIILTLVLCLLIAGAAIADEKILTKSVTSSSPAGGAATNKEMTSTVYLGKQQMRKDDEKTSTFFDFTQKKIFFADHGAKITYETALPLDISNLMSPEQAAMMKQMTGGGTTLTVTPVDETKTVAGHQTRRYDVTFTMMGSPVKLTMWAAKTVGNAEIARALYGSMAAIPGIDSASLAQLQKIEGYPLLTESSASMMGQTITGREEVLSIEPFDPPAGHYAPPADYPVQPLTMQAMQTMSR